jgi:SnoaL-like domain
MEMAAEIPEVIQRYQDAHDRHDVEGALAAFSAEATVHDEGQQWRGTTEIRNWLNKTSSEYTFTRTLLSVETTGAGSWEVRNRLEGNFPGNVVDLRYRFALDGDKITNLIIAL